MAEPIVSGTVTVGCKLPNGLLLQVFRMEDHDEPLQGGGMRTVKRAVAASEAVRINGAARFVGKDSPHDIVSAAGITYGVDAALFAEWMRQNKDSEVVKRGLVFAQARDREIRAQAKDHASLRTGLEPLNPDLMPDEFAGKIKTFVPA